MFFVVQLDWYKTGYKWDLPPGRSERNGVISWLDDAMKSGIASCIWQEVGSGG